MARASGDRLQGRRIEAALGLATALATLSPTIATTPKPTKSLERASFRVFKSGIFHCKKPPTKD
jgi:hypothetical protein